MKLHAVWPCAPKPKAGATGQGAYATRLELREICWTWPQPVTPTDSFRPMSGELVAVQTAATAVNALVTASSTVLSQLRANGTVRSEARERLRIALAELRRGEIASSITNLQLQGMQDVKILFDRAQEYQNSPAYPHAMEAAHEAARQFQQNIQKFIKEAR